MSKFEIVWQSADGKGEIQGPANTTVASLGSDIAHFEAELLDQCADDAERDGIRSGKIVIIEDGDVSETREIAA